ncbi:MAG: hypothetical protein JWO89_2510 [Verrucomicrobiaceae bacterium]|nr:hypothetical protein [Verrucomicrobiaceae bacterium]
MQTEKLGSAAALEAQRVYNEEVRAAVKSLAALEGTAGWGKPFEVKGSTTAWRISPDQGPSSPGVSRTLSLGGFAHCRVSAEVKVTGFDHVTTHPGVGVPVVLVQDEPLRAQRPLHPAKGDYLPATAVLEFAEGTGTARLRLYDPLAVREIKAGPASLPLAEDVTAPLEFSLTDSTVDEDEEGHLAPSVTGEDESKLFFINRYDPAKVPVVFVHGLRSGPVIWKNAINQLLADPELRRRYQPVCFVYPTGLSIPTSAARLRQLLKEARAKLDPHQRDAGFQHMVLVGHSMGGLLSRMQVVDSGMDFWRAFYTASPDKIESELDAPTRRMVRGSLMFHHLPNVRTVVFITTPHQGSEVADIGLVRTVANVILTLPKTARKRFQSLTALPPAYINPALRSFNEWGNTGVENLSTKHPYFQALARRPLQVPFHSVIGVGNAVDPMQGTDGVVPYKSAHLSGATTEDVVPYPHGCVERSGTVGAVLKILKDTR